MFEVISVFCMVVSIIGIRKINKEKFRNIYYLSLMFLFLMCVFQPVAGCHAKEVHVTADTGQIEDVQALLDESAENPQDKYVIKVPAGTYTMDRKLIVYSNTILNLKGVTYKRGAINGSMLFLGTGSGGGYSMGHDITIRGGVFHGGTSTDIPDLCVFSHLKNVTFDGCTFKYMPSKKLKTGNRNTHMIEFAGCKNVMIKNCRFYNNKNALPNNEAVQIESLRNEKALVSTTPADFGKRDGTQCSNVTISKCRFSGFNYGCGSNHLSKKDHFRNMKFLNNTFIGAKKYAICLYGYRNVTIKGNKLVRSGSLYQNQGATGVKAS